MFVCLLFQNFRNSHTHSKVHYSFAAGWPKNISHPIGNTETNIFLGLAPKNRNRKIEINRTQSNYWCSIAERNRTSIERNRISIERNRISLERNRISLERNRISLESIEFYPEFQIRLVFDCVRQSNFNHSIAFDCVQLIRRSIRSIDIVWIRGEKFVRFHWPI